MSSHHFNGQCCYLHQIIFQSHNNCLITKLFQGVFCHDITKLLKLAQNDMVLFYFLKMFWCALQTSPHLLHPQQEEHWHSPFPLVASMLAPPASAYASPRYCLCLTDKNSRLFFLKCWQPWQCLSQLTVTSRAFPVSTKQLKTCNIIGQYLNMSADSFA